MRRRSRTRRVVKWLGTGFCTVVLAIWFLSIQAPGFWDRHFMQLTVWNGYIQIEVYEVRGEFASAGEFKAYLREHHNAGWCPLPPSPWTSLESYGLGLPRVRRNNVVPLPKAHQCGGCS